MRTKRGMKAESAVGVLLAVSLFAVLCLSYMRWQSAQHQQTQFLYQQRQALQLAENQLHLRMAHGTFVCEPEMSQNQIRFQLECSESQVRVTFPLGEVIIR